MDSRKVALIRDPVLWLGATCIAGFVAFATRSMGSVEGTGLAGILMSSVALFLLHRHTAMWLGHCCVTIVLMAQTGTVDSMSIVALASALGLLGALGFSLAYQMAIEAPTEPEISDVAAPRSVQMLSLLEIEERDDLEEADADMGTLLQHWERRRHDDGSESFSALLRVQFQPGERIRLEHVPIYPPLGQPGELWLQVVEGANLSVEQDLLKSYGIRVTVRRRGDLNSAAQALISVAGTSASRSRAA